MPNASRTAIEDYERLEALRKLCLLDTGTDPAFDRITRMASKLLNAPIALVSLVDDKRQFFKSQVGLAEPLATQRETPLSHSFCQHVVATQSPLIIENAARHEWVYDNPAVTEYAAIAYAGIPLTTPSGHTLGTLCVIDHQERQWTTDEIETLTDLAASVMSEIQLRSEVIEHERSKTVLAASQETYRSLARIAPVGIFHTDARGNYTYINDTWLKITHIPAHEALERGWMDYLHPQDRDWVIEEWQRSLRSGKPFNAEFRFLVDTDTPTWVVAQTTPIHAETQKIYGYLGTITDITREKQAEDTLKRSEQLFHSLVDTAPVLIWIAGTNKMSTYFNKLWLEFTGRALEQELEIGWSEGIHPDDRHECLSTYSTAFDERREFRMEYRLRRADGQYRWLLDHGIPRFLADDTFIGYIGTCIDITERKEMEDALRKSEERYRIVSELISDYAYSYRIAPDGTRQHEWTTESFTRLTGYSPEDLNTGISLYHPDDREQASLDVQRVLKGETVAGEYRVITRSGKTLWLAIHRYPAWDEEHTRVVRYFGIAQEITERKHAEEARLESERLRIALEKEQELGEMRTRLMATISHEFRTPLATIQTAGDLLNRYFDRMTPPQRQEKLHTIETQVRQMAEMVDDISLVVQGTLNHLSFSPEIANLAAYCTQLVEQMGKTTAAQHTLTLEMSGDLENIIIDMRLIRRMIINLVSNAIKYSPPHSEVCLIVRRERRTLTIQVSDQGMGIPKHEQERIFDAFYRASNVGTIGGTGFGLRVVKDCVALHGGTIDFHSELGKGTTFTITLPLW